MNKIFKVFLFCFFSLPIQRHLLAQSANADIYNLSAQDIDNQTINFSSFKNKVILIFNFSSKCATASQLSNFESLSRKFKEQDLIVIAAPSSDFAPMYIKNPNALKDFCKNKYQTSFRVLAELHVKGEKIHPLFKFLTTSDLPELAGEVAFNMEKFLINRRGVLVKRFGPFTGATSKKLMKDIEEVLTEGQQ
jgi:glutathione peroxidase